MATLEDILASALGSGVAQVAADDPYLPMANIGQQVGELFVRGAAARQPSSSNTREAILGAALSGLFGGAMNTLSSNYQTDRTAKYNDLLLQAMAGRDVTGSDAVTPALARMAQNQANVLTYQNKANEIDELRKLMFDVKKSELTAEATKRGEMAAYDDIASVDGARSVDTTPIAKKLINPMLEKNISYIDTLRKEFMGNEAYKNFAKAQTGFQTLIAAKNDPSKVSDLDFVYGAIQMIEPGMAVKEGEQAAVINTQSIPDRLKSQMLSALEGKASLNQETRDAILRLGGRRFDQYKKQYDALLGGYKNRATEVTGEVKPDITFLPEVGASSDLLGAMPETKPTIDITEQLNRIKNQLANNPNLSPEVRQRLADKARALVRGQ